jgi:hypothetical protein
MMGAQPITWLLEPDNPSARYLALTRLLDRPQDDPEVIAARSAIAASWPAQAILAAQWPDGYWMRPGLGYSPKYKATVWQLIFLAALGTPRTIALDRACAYVLAHSRMPDGRFSAQKTAQGAVLCLNGNLLRALSQLAYDDPRREESLEALAQMVTRDRFRCRFNATSPKPSLMSDGLPCAWGAVKALAAFAEVPRDQRSPAMSEAIQSGISFLLSCDLAAGSYPAAYGPSPLWQQFSFPLGYTSDVLEVLDVLGRLGVREEPRLAEAIALIRAKADARGQWALEHALDNTWAAFGRVGQPNKWVTLRAFGALKHWSAGL